MGIDVDCLLKRFGEAGGTLAVNNVSFRIERGSAVGILGPNGAGKTTMIKCLLGLVLPTSGDVLIDGIDVRAAPRQAHRLVGATLEGARNTYWRLTVKENMDFFAALAGLDPRNHRNRHEELLARFEIQEEANTVVRELSRGQKQKVSLACTLARDADYLILDEPTLGLDVESSLELRRELRRLVDDDETTVLLCSHDMAIVEEVCDRVIIMNDGRIVADNSVEVLDRLFDSKQYEVSISGKLPTWTRRLLESNYNAKSFEDGTNRTRFTVSVVDDDFYELIDLLRDAEVSLHSITTTNSNLEHAFLEITEGNNSPRSDVNIGES